LVMPIRVKGRGGRVVTGLVMLPVVFLGASALHAGTYFNLIHAGEELATIRSLMRLASRREVVRIFGEAHTRGYFDQSALGWHCPLPRLAETGDEAIYVPMPFPASR